MRHIMFILIAILLAGCVHHHRSILTGQVVCSHPVPNPFMHGQCMTVAGFDTRQTLRNNMIAHVYAADTQADARVRDHFAQQYRIDQYAIEFAQMAENRNATMAKELTEARAELERYRRVVDALERRLATVSMSASAQSTVLARELQDAQARAAIAEKQFEALQRGLRHTDIDGEK